jgi:hypothetical protein
MWDEAYNQELKRLRVQMKDHINPFIGSRIFERGT